jgi:hypothetical protein
MESITETTNRASLMEEVQRLVEAHRSAFGQERCYWRMVGLTLAMIFCFGRRTVTQLLLTLGLTDTDWSAMYRLFSQKRFDELKMARCLLRETLAHVGADELYVVGTDGTQIPRSSQRMPGTAWLKSPRSPVFKPGIHRAQRFVHGCWFTLMEGGFSRAIPLRFLPAFPEKAVKAEADPCKEWEAGVSFVNWVRKELDAVRSGQPMLWLADGSYDTVEMWRSAPERVIAAVRTAKNRVLYAYLPPEERRRNRKYGERMPTPEEYMRNWRQDSRTTTLLVRGTNRRLRYRIVGPVVRRGVADVPLFLVVVSGQTYQTGKVHTRRKERKPAAYLVTAQCQDGEWVFPLDPTLLLTWLWQRWEMEVAHREMKSSLGVGEQQCWTPRSAIVSVQWSVWVYAILVLAGYRAWHLSHGPSPTARWSPQPKRWSFNTLWRTYRAELWTAPDYRAIWTRTTGNWPDTEAYLDALNNAIAGAVRA